jgi:hypothetical protein
MLRRICVLCLYLLFCNLHCKGLTIDLEAEFPDKSTISVFYFDQVQNFSMKEMLDGVEKDHVCDVIFYSNTKEPVEVILSSKDKIDSFFCFKNEEKKIPFYLTKKSTKEQVFNGSTIYLSTHTKEPINTVISLGICVPSVDKSLVIGGDFSTFFTINLKPIG